MNEPVRFEQSSSQEKSRAMEREACVKKSKEVNSETYEETEKDSCKEDSSKGYEPSLWGFFYLQRDLDVYWREDCREDYRRTGDPVFNP